MDKLQKFDDVVKPYLTFLNNQYVSAVLYIILIVYASLAAPRLPHNIAKLFDNPVVKLVLFFLIVYLAKHDATIAIIASVGVLISLMTLNRYTANSEMMSIVSRDNMINNLDKCNDWNCDNEEQPQVMSMDNPWENRNVEENGRPYLEGNPSGNLHPFNGLSEEEKVREIMNEKAMIESQINRPLSENELKDLCANMANAPAPVIGRIGQNATTVLNNEKNIEGYDQTESSTYASV